MTLQPPEAQQNQEPGFLQRLGQEWPSYVARAATIGGAVAGYLGADHYVTNDLYWPVRYLLADPTSAVAAGSAAGLLTRECLSTLRVHGQDRTAYENNVWETSGRPPGYRGPLR